MPRDVKEGQKGLVVLRFAIQSDGTLREDDIRVEKEFAGEILLEKSLSALRQSAPFPAFPAGWTRPEIILRYTFEFSLTPHPGGCP
jgi:outer membrane biosynthesis protein TonB